MNRQPEQLRRGLQAHRREQERAAVARVRAFERWLKAGSDIRRIPEIPSDADYVIARRRSR